MMIDIQADFNDFFKMYPRGYCLFLLASPEKSIIFGPDIDYSFKTSALSDEKSRERIAAFLRSSLNKQLIWNTQKDQSKIFMMFYCERKGTTELEAKDIAYQFQGFFNYDVCRNNGELHNPNHAMPPIHLRDIIYRNHAGGIGLDKKRDFVYLIHSYQENFEQSKETLPFCVKKDTNLKTLYQPFTETKMPVRRVNSFLLFPLISTLIMALLPFIIIFF